MFEREEDHAAERHLEEVRSDIEAERDHLVRVMTRTEPCEHLETMIVCARCLEVLG